jgi:hypothetical protein
MSREKSTKKSETISRREFIRDAGLVASGAALGSAVLLSSCAGTATTETVTKTVTGAATTSTVTATVTSPAKTVTITAPATIVAAPKLTVPNPCGYIAPIDRLSMAPRKAKLSDYGKIWIVDITFSGSYEMAAVIKEWFSANQPALNVEVTKEIGSYSVADEDTLWKKIQATPGGGAAIVVGGH